MPPERYTITISGERSGRILRQVVVSEATASKIIGVLDAGGEIVQAGADLMRAARELGRVLEPLTAPKKLPPRGRR